MLHNTALIASLVSWGIAQGIKFIWPILLRREINFRRLVETGGMPSAHTAFVSALATTVAFKEGWDSPIFALAVVFSLVVMYDATGIRQAAGKQAAILNRIVDDLYHDVPLKPQYLRELLGHTPFEVFVGAILGFWVGWAFCGYPPL
ncbi:MAG TPA: divergent PAP2 family protein [Bacillota bacterium]